MKNLFCILILFFSIIIEGISQSDITGEEVIILAKDLAAKLNNKCKNEKVLVMDFTDNADQPTEMGAYLADEFTTALLNESAKFSIKDRSSLKQLPKETSTAPSSIVNDLINSASTLTENLKLTSKKIEILQTATTFAPIMFSSSSADKRIKDVDIMIFGKITTMGDTYRINISASKRKGADMVATTKGDITKTDLLSDLDSRSISSTNIDNSTNNDVTNEVSNPTLTKSTSPFNSGLSMTKSKMSNDNSGPEYKKHPITFKSLGCSMDGRYLDCIVRVSTDASSINLIINRNQTKLIDQNGGTEFFTSDIIFGDKSIKGSSSVEKDLVNNIPVNLTLRFEPGKVIDVIGRLNIYFHDSVNGDWVIGDLNSIIVK